VETLITAALFAAVTGVFIALHVRGKKRAGKSTAAAAAPCPRCSRRVPAGSERCPSCGVPLQAYELVSAGLASDTAEAASVGTPHAIVRADTCVGCGACVAACPEPGAIRLEGKVAVVDLARCKGHGECATACPVGGIVVASGAAVQRVETPSLDAHFETNVPGLYVVGELGGRGLIKNAINEGKIAMEEVARRVRATPRPAGVPDLFDVAVVGSGPAGLSAGLEALRQKLDYVVLERGDLSDTIRRYPRHKILMAEPVKVPLYGDLWVADASKESLLGVWQTIVAETGLQVRTGRSVERVASRNGWIEVAAAGPEGPETYRARHVVLALGRRGTPRRLEVPGEELPKVFYDVVEMEAFARSRVLVVGGGDSAIEVVVGLARQPGTTVTLSYRGAQFTRIKERNRRHLEEALAAHRVEVLLESRVREIRADSVVVDVAGSERIVANDYVIVRAGGVPPFDFLRAAGVRIVTKEIAIGGAPEPAAA
jgi:thioredoxin reductase/NAD-dependent dihydropyrimidine dehydrogenase PreA subunit